MTAFAWDDSGRLYIATQDGALLRVDVGSGHLPGRVQRIASGLRAPLGLVFHQDALYISGRGGVDHATDADADGDLDTSAAIVTGLPSGNHQNNGPAIGPDGTLYLPVGSTCNACTERDSRSATVMRYELDGSGGEVYASGLRNVYQLAFHPEDASLWGADNGRDDFGHDVPEELNRIVQGGDYGWPYCWGVSGGTNCEVTLALTANLKPRSSADGMVFYTGGQLPDAYRNDLFVTLWGAHDRSTGQKVQRIQLTRDGDGYHAQVSDFATGFDRPLPITVAPDGALPVGDFGNGRIVRINYVGP